MRVLASVILLSLALNLATSAKAETSGELNQNTIKKTNNGLNKIEKDNKNIEIDKLEIESNGRKISSANSNFIAAIYIAEISSKKIYRAKGSTFSAASLPRGSFTINASAYTAAADECGKSDGITASGIKVHKGTLACPPQFPFGTKIEIEEMGEFVCEDRGGAIKGNHVDIYMQTKKEAFAFGRRNLTAMIVR